MEDPICSLYVTNRVREFYRRHQHELSPRRVSSLLRDGRRHLRRVQEANKGDQASAQCKHHPQSPASADIVELAYGARGKLRHILKQPLRVVPVSKTRLPPLPSQVVQVSPGEEVPNLPLEVHQAIAARLSSRSRKSRRLYRNIIAARVPAPVIETWHGEALLDRERTPRKLRRVLRREKKRVFGIDGHFDAKEDADLTFYRQVLELAWPMKKKKKHSDPIVVDTEREELVYADGLFGRIAKEVVDKVDLTRAVTPLHPRKP